MVWLRADDALCCQSKYSLHQQLHIRGTQPTCLSAALYSRLFSLMLFLTRGGENRPSRVENDKNGWVRFGIFSVKCAAHVFFRCVFVHISTDMNKT